MFVICCIRSFMLHARVIYSCVRAFVRDLILKTTAAVATTAVAAAAVPAVVSVRAAANAGTATAPGSIAYAAAAAAAGIAWDKLLK